MYIAPTPTIIAGIIGAVIGWLVADRNCSQSKQEENTAAGDKSSSD